jgi:hypothetical protein
MPRSTPLIIKKNLSACKPDSVPRPDNIGRGGHHLSGCNITVAILLPTLQRFRIAGKLSEPPSNADIRGITAHKVYPINALLQKPVSSYLTFSPWPSPVLLRQAQHDRKRW